MLKLYRYDGKSKEETIASATTELNCTEADLLVSLEEIEGKLFKSKKYQLYVLKKEDIKKEIKDFIQILSHKMNIEINIEIKETDGIFNVLLISDNNSILIGKEGRTINSLQLILRQYLNRNGIINVKVNLDVSNYKAKKIKNIEYEIKKIAISVIKSHVDVKLDPMNSYERRLVHTIISNYPELETESFGEEPSRYVVIKYRED